MNSPLAQERAQFGALRLKRLAHWLERFTWRSATRVLAVTEVRRATIAAAGIPHGRTLLTPNGIDLQTYSAPRTAASAAAGVTLGFVGFVREWHGLDAVLSAMAERPQAFAGLTLTVVGDGPARPALRSQAARLGLAERVRFPGVVVHQDIPVLLAGFDIALQPRAVCYASPLKIFEYMAAGCAIVAPAQPNILEILEHERTALLFDPEELGAMAAAILRLAANATLRQELGLAARAEIRRLDYTWAGNVRRIERAFTDLRPVAANSATPRGSPLPLGGANP